MPTKQSPIRELEIASQSALAMTLEDSRDSRRTFTALSLNYEIPIFISSKISTASVTSFGQMVVKSFWFLACSRPSGVPISQPSNSVQFSDLLRATNCRANFRMTAYVFCFAALSSALTVPDCKPRTMNAPDTAPQVSPNPPHPPPNPDAIFSAVCSSSASCSPYPVRTACDQAKPLSK